MKVWVRCEKYGHTSSNNGNGVTRYKGKSVTLQNVINGLFTFCAVADARHSLLSNYIVLMYLVSCNEEMCSFKSVRREMELR